MENTIIISGGIDMEKKVSTLKEISIDADNYATYYLDERNGEKWVEEKPFSEMHAGGPSQLRLIEKFPWE